MSFKFMAIAFLFAAPACSYFLGSTPQSSWAELTQVTDVSCRPWPLPPGDLGIFALRLLPSGDDRWAYVVETKSRRGEELFYTGTLAAKADWQREFLSAAPAQRQKGHRQWIGAGAGFWASLLEPQLEGGQVEGRVAAGSALSLVPWGQTEATPALYPLPPESSQLRLQAGEGGGWLSLRAGEAAGFLRLKFLTLAPATQTLQELAIDGSFPAATPPVGLGDPLKAGGLAYLLTLAPSQGEESQGELAVLTLHKLAQGGKVERVFTSSLPAPAGLEDWAVVADAQGHFYLAYTAGDSLIGAANLYLAAWRWQKGEPKLIWQQSFPMPSLHLGELHWLRGEKQHQLFFLKWLDGEATLAAFSVSPAGGQPLASQGIFPKGSTLLAAVPSRAEGRTYGLIRYPRQWLWQYDLCPI